MNRPLLLVMLLLVNGWLTGCAAMVATGVANPSLADGRSRAETQSDAEITNHINSMLVRDADIPAMDVRVSTYRGVVTLRGHVASRSVVERTLRLANSVSGVRSVKNRLTY